MLRKKYTAKFKTKIVLSILQGDKEFNVICSENSLHPNMVRKWKQDFLQNAHLIMAQLSRQKSKDFIMNIKPWHSLSALLDSTA
jgi:transposase-like protein